MLLALQEIGYDGSNHRSQGISENLLSWADIIVCMGNVHVKRIEADYPQHSHKVSNWLIDDPHFATGMDKHRAVTKEIEQKVKNLLCE